MCDDTQLRTNTRPRPSTHHRSYYRSFCSAASAGDTAAAWYPLIHVTNYCNQLDDRVPVNEIYGLLIFPWWRHQMETVSALLALCAENSPVTGEFPSLRPGTRSSDVFFDLRLNKPLNKQSRGWWFETPLRSLWLHRKAKWFTWRSGTRRWNLRAHDPLISCSHHHD